MKKIAITSIIFLTCFAGIKIATEKYYNFKMTPETFFKHYNKLNAIKKILDGSDLPHNQVSFALLSIDSLQMDFVQQLPDSVKQSPKNK